MNDAAIERCQEVLEVIADSWADMKAIEMRGSIEETDSARCRGSAAGVGAEQQGRHCS